MRFCWLSPLHWTSPLVSFLFCDKIRNWKIQNDNNETSLLVSVLFWDEMTNKIIQNRNETSLLVSFFLDKMTNKKIQNNYETSLLVLFSFWDKEIESGWACVPCTGAVFPANIFHNPIKDNWRQHTISDKQKSVL